MRQSTEIVPAEMLQIENEAETGISWFWLAYEVAEAQLNRSVMRLLTAIFAGLIVIFYIAFAAILCWQPGA